MPPKNSVMEKENFKLCAESGIKVGSRRGKVHLDMNFVQLMRSQKGTP